MYSSPQIDSVDLTWSISSWIKNSIPLRKVSSSRAPSAHHPALVLIQDGILGDIDFVCMDVSYASFPNSVVREFPISLILSLVNISKSRLLLISPEYSAFILYFPIDDSRSILYKVSKCWSLFKITLSDSIVSLGVLIEMITCLEFFSFLSTSPKIFKYCTS